jgi:hypothetical protein
VRGRLCDSWHRLLAVRGASFGTLQTSERETVARLLRADGFCFSEFGDHGRPVGAWDAVPGQWDIVPMIPDVCATVLLFPPLCAAWEAVYGPLTPLGQD